MTTVGTTERLLWLDLETTGLDPATCGIIEVAWAVTPLEIGPLDTVRSKLVSPGDAAWEPGAYEMHTASKLAALAVIRGGALDDIEHGLLDSLPDGTLYLAGSSIHFDRGFIRRHMPVLEARLHYRMLDVSAVVLARRAQGWVSPPSLDPKPHRAEQDLRASHALLRAAMEQPSALDAFTARCLKGGASWAATLADVARFHLEQEGREPTREAIGAKARELGWKP